MYYSKFVCGLALAVGAANGAAHNLVRRDGAGGHHHAHAAAPQSSSGYGAPAQASSYAAPASDYGAPASDYGAPASDYGAPASDYGAPATSYGAPSDSYGVSYAEEGGPDIGNAISIIIVGWLIIAGLSLLFPTISNVTVRKRRETADGKTSYTQTYIYTTFTLLNLLQRGLCTK